eukprot:scaffold22532_cov126-Skeletonema_marinoi.AAC.2
MIVLIVIQRTPQAAPQRREAASGRASKMFELKRKACYRCLFRPVSAPRTAKQRLFVVASNHVGCEYGDVVDGCSY